MSDLGSKYAKNILQDKTCDTCDYEMFCKKRNKKLYLPVQKYYLYYNIFLKK